MQAKLSSKGQVTVPKIYRDKLGLKTGTVLDFEAIDGVLVIKKVKGEDVFHKWRGRGQRLGGMGVDDYLKTIRQ